MKHQVFFSNNDWAGLIIRLTVAIIMFPHGGQHALGIFGGYGFDGTMGWLTNTMHIPWIISFLAIMIEIVGPLFLLLGFASRVWAVLMTILMIGIIFSSHIQNGFFMDWVNTMDGEGYEYHLLFIGLCLALLVNGGGKFSVDALVVKESR